MKTDIQVIFGCFLNMKLAGEELKLGYKEI